MGTTLSIDFGVNVPGESGISATGTTDLTAYVLHKKVTVFTTVVANGRALLPSSYASGSELKVLNRGANVLSISAGSNQIETYGTVATVAPGGNATFCSFDPPASPSPRTWWLTALMVLLLGIGSASAQAPCVGTLLTQNKLSEIASCGTAAQQAAQVNLGLGATPGPFLPLAGGTVTGPTTFSNGTLTLAGASSITSNATAINLNTSHGTPFKIFDNNVTVANGIELQTGSTATSPAEFTMQAGASGGIQWAMPFEVTVPTIGAISSASGLAGNFTSTFNGQTGNVAQYGLFVINPTLGSGFVSSAPMFDVYLPVGILAGASALSAGGMYLNFNEAGAPAALANWTTGTVYAKGALVQNAGSMYGAQNPGTSGASAPTCSSGTCSDGAVTWLYSGASGSYMTLTGGAFYTTSAFNDGGTSTAPVGNLFGLLFGATANSGATNKVSIVGGEDDCQMNTGASAARFACMQFVKIGAAQGWQSDWGVSIATRSGTAMNNPLIFNNATAANGVAIEIADQSGTTGLQVMAGGFDCVLCSPTGSNNFTDGHLGTGGGGYIVRGPNSQLLGSGDLQLGYTLFHISAGGLTIDTSYSLLTSVSAPTGGTNWSNNEHAYDVYGNQATVAASGGVPSSITVIATTGVPTASVPGGAVTWCPVGASPSFLTSTGSAMSPTCFTTTETYTAGTGITIGGVSVTTLAFGNSGSATTIAGGLTLSSLGTGTATKYLCLTSGNVVIAQAGAC